MNELVKTFDGHDVRMIIQNGEPWWVLKDVCDVLGLQAPHMVAGRLDDDERSQTSVIDSIGRSQDTTIINESGLYSVILRSNKPDAVRFRKWITSEVLPSIRKTGGYKLPTGPELMALALIEAQKVIEQKDRLIEEQKPAVQFMADVTGSRDAIEMSQVAKIIDMGMGRNQLFDYLRSKLVLRANNEPYQKYIDLGWFRVVEQPWKDANGNTHISIKTLVYQKGIDGIIKMIRMESMDD